MVQLISAKPAVGRASLLHWRPTGTPPIHLVPASPVCARGETSEGLRNTWATPRMPSHLPDRGTSCLGIGRTRQISSSVYKYSTLHNAIEVEFTSVSFFVLTTPSGPRLGPPSSRVTLSGIGSPQLNGRTITPGWQNFLKDEVPFH